MPEAHAVMLAAVTERQIQEMVRQTALKFGWLAYHSWTSLYSPSGYPDVVALRGERLVVAEIKGPRGKLSPEQWVWLDGWLNIPNAEVYLWQVNKMVDDREEIAHILWGDPAPEGGWKSAWRARREHLELRREP